ncbi:MAG: hypothetical protein ACE5EC_07735 [Phycisphaerae bacterium]
MTSLRCHTRRAVTRLEILVGLCVVCLAGWFIIPAMTRNRTRIARELCLTHLNGIGRALGSYLQDSGNRWPYVAKLRSYKLHDPPWPTLARVLEPYVAETGNGETDQGTSVFHCPSDARTLDADDPLSRTFSRRTTYFETEGLSYAWYWSDSRAGKKIGRESLSSAEGFGMGRADQPLLTDFEPFHKGDDHGALNTLFADMKARTNRGKETRIANSE